jgi:hypothetical protein
MSGSVFAFALNSSDDLYVGGQFTLVGGSTTRNRLCKFSSSGTLDAFDPKMNGTVNALALNSSGHLLVGGNYTSPSSYFTVYTGAGTSVVLPVELLSFSGKYIPPSGGLKGANEGANLLTWATASEVNNKGFEVQASPDLSKGGEWQTLGFVAAKGKGSNYEFTDKAPLWGVGGLSYYRLRQIDNDGKETLSKVISIEQKGNGKGLAVYPNPVTNTLNIENTVQGTPFGEGVNFQILNLLGQQVLSGKTAAQVDVSALLQGTYFLKAGAEQVKFIKQ